MWDGQLSNHTYRLLFKHGVSPSSAILRERQTNQMPSRSYQLPPPSPGELEETIRTSPYYVDEDYSAGPEIIEPVRERSNRHGSESSTLEIDVYVWRYALIVVHARNERTIKDNLKLLQNIR